MNKNEARERAPDYDAKTPDQYTFDYEPIRGYPELRWTGKRPFRGTSYFPAQLKESHGDTMDGWKNKLYWGDNLQVMSHLLREYRGKVRLIYIDPPFDSKADYKKTIELRGLSASSDSSAFEEKQYTDIWTNDEYLQFMYERLILMRELLAEDGSIYLHVDWRKLHIVKVILDEVFGIENFQNEIVWSFIKGASSKAAFGRKHQTILFYSRSSTDTIFNLDDVRVDYNPETIARAKRGEARYTNTSAEELEEKGKNPGDVWSDIFPIQGNSNENVLYPTQKPEALLERIIKASSNPGDLVFDCFMGSGTTQAVAMKLGRRFLGADINLGAIQTTTKRLLGVAEELRAETRTHGGELGLGFDKPLSSSVSSVPPYDDSPSVRYTGFEVYTVNNYDFFKNELEAKELLIEALELQKLPGNMLWDGEADGWMVKILAVNRLATAADLNPILSNLDYKAWEKRAKENPSKSVERIRLVCMGHDPELRAQFQKEMDQLGYKVDLDIVDILRDRKELQFKREAEARMTRGKKRLDIKSFYPMNLLQKLSLEKKAVGEWRELVDSVLIDWNYDGAVFSPGFVDVPGKSELVRGSYDIPDGAGTIRVKITDLIAESWEGDVEA